MNAELFKCKVVINPKNGWSMGPQCVLTLTPSEVRFNTNPPLAIPYGQINVASVRQFTDGVLEHGGQRTVFRGASIWSGALEAQRLIRIINRARVEGTRFLEN